MTRVALFGCLWLLLGLVWSACGDAGQPAPKVEAPGAEGFRNFLPVLQDALDRGDVEFVTDRLRGELVTCTPDDVPIQIGGPACETVGQTFDGMPLGRWRAEGNTVPVETVADSLRELFSDVDSSAKDEFGDGDLQVYALDITGDHYTAVITAMIDRPPNFAGTGPLRVADSTQWSFNGGRWALSGILVAYVLAEDLLIPTEEGKPYFPNWEHYEP